MSDNQTEFSNLKVMIIDDSKTIRRSAETLLKKAGCEVLTAENGFEALPIISAEHPDILFIDIMMPRLDGYQTCSLVKSNPNFSDIPIIMLSSKDGLFDRAKGRVVGAEEYLTKPFTREDLLNAIRKHLPDDSDDAYTNVATPAAASAVVATDIATAETETDNSESSQPLELATEEPTDNVEQVTATEDEAELDQPQNVDDQHEPLEIDISEQEPIELVNEDSAEVEATPPSEPLSLVEDSDSTPLTLELE